MSNYLEKLSKDKDEIWEISFLDDFVYTKNSKQVFYISARIVLKKIESNFSKTLYFNIDQIFNKVIGSFCDSEGNVVSNKFNLESEKFIFKVNYSDLNKTSEKLIRYKDFNLGVDQIKNFENEILIPNKLYNKLHYAPVHLIKGNRINNDIDFFILPSYEVMRYFFLKGSKLNKFLLKKFLFSKKDFKNEDNELYIKLDSNNGEEGKFLLTKQGFSDVEYEAICRMAYLKNGFKCIEEIRKSLLINSQNNIEYEYKTLRTVLPQDEPFEILSSGKKFQFKGKNYLLINQIHGTKETLPIKDIMLLFFTDRRRNKINDEREGKEGNDGGKDSRGNKKRTLKKSKPKENAKLTSELLGNADIQADIKIDSISDRSFDGDKFNFTKLEKVSGEYKYNGTITIEIPKDTLSLLDEIDKNTNVGRANTVSNEKDNSVVDQLTKARREIFYDAIEALNPEFFGVHFFQISEGKNNQSLLLSSRTLVKPYKNDDLFETIICQVSIYNDNELYYLYLVKSDNHQDEVSRYAIFNNNLFRKFDLKKIESLYIDFFSKKGLRFKVEDLNNNRYNLKGSLEFHNQSNRKGSVLKDKIEKEIKKKIKSLN